jgi:hypothetical protein
LERQSYFWWFAGPVNLQIGSRSAEFLRTTFVDLNVDYGTNKGFQADGIEGLRTILMSLLTYQSVTLAQALEIRK